LSIPGTPSALPTTLGELRASSWRPRSVKAEVRDNAAARIASGKPVVEGLVGYDDTVLPALENALIAGHDVIFLGERGQAKTRLMRALVALLDEAVPVVAGSEILDDPYRPVSRYAKELVAAKGDDTPIEWAGRDQRFSEKLATPDTSIADLIGEVDPVKVAEGRYLSDELTLHYGLVPRTNRGIFAVNELPDLAERIQVGLLNLLEERDVQVRGYKVRLNLDLLFLASANPEDYTSRGRIITPLKDRFGAQIRTHYPLDTATEVRVITQEAELRSLEGVKLDVPEYMTEVVAAFSQLARQSPQVNQRSGVSVRLSVANYETLAAAALRRAVRLREPVAVPRVSDLPALVASSAGKIELDSLDDAGEDDFVARLCRQAVLGVFRSRVSPADLGRAVAELDDGSAIEVGDDVPSAEYVRALDRHPGLRAPAARLAGSDSPPALAAASELILEGLHLSKRLNKHLRSGGATYTAKGRQP
jgi:magnesium chelatase subunit I